MIRSCGFSIAVPVPGIMQSGGFATTYCKTNVVQKYEGSLGYNLKTFHVQGKNK